MTDRDSPIASDPRSDARRGGRLRTPAAILTVWVANHVVSRVPIHRVRTAYYRRLMGFQIGAQAVILTDVRFARRGNLSIGPGAVINNGCRIDNRFAVHVGRSTSLSYGTFVLTKGHDIDDPQFRTRGAPVVIGDYVWCTVRTTVLPGVTLGDRAVVLPGSVVSSDVEAGTVVGGIPARLVRTRDVELSDVPPYTGGHNPVFG